MEQMLGGRQMSAKVKTQLRKPENNSLGMGQIIRYDPSMVITMLVITIAGFVLSCLTFAIATHLLQRESSIMNRTVKGMTF